VKEKEVLGERGMCGVKASHGQTVDGREVSMRGSPEFAKVSLTILIKKRKVRVRKIAALKERAHKREREGRIHRLQGRSEETFQSRRMCP